MAVCVPRRKTYRRHPTARRCSCRRDTHGPVHVRARPAGSFAAAGWQRAADGSFETRVAPEAKLALLADLLARPGGLADLTVTEPTLDDLYAHFLRREAA